MWYVFAAVVACLAALAGAAGSEELRTPPEKRLPPPEPALEVPDDRTSWERQRGEIRRDWEQILGPMPQRVPLETQELSREELDDHLRLRLRYRIDDTTRGEAYLLLPKGFEGPRPGMVCLHPTSKTTLKDPVGLRNREVVHHALHLVRRGYVCVAPANFLWEVPGQSYQQAAERVLTQGPYETGMARMVWDAIRAVDVLLERPELDPQRIGTIGHSLGGKEALYLAAFDQRVAAAISSEGGVGLSFSNWDADWYLGKQITSPDFRHDNHEVMALIAPRALLIIGGESADGAQSWPFIEAVLPIWRLYDAEDRLGLLRHDQGHDFPSPGLKRDLAYRWLDDILTPAR